LQLCGLLGDRQNPFRMLGGPELAYLECAATRAVKEQLS
jgi:hypothetical protein